MNKKELIAEIEIKLRDNDGINFDEPLNLAMDELLSISYCGELNFTDDDVELELEDLHEDQLSDLLYEIERQIEADEKVFDRCRGSYY